MQAVARMEQGLEEHAHAQAATDDTVQHLHSTVVDTRNDLIETVEYLYQVCSLLIERTESEKIERQALLEWMAELTRSSGIEPSRSGDRVLGGSFSALPAETLGSDAEMDRQSNWA